MKKLAFLGWLIVFLPAILFAQEKVEAPIWNVGDKWIFTGAGTIEILKVEQKGIVVKFSDNICVLERQGFNTIIFDKSTLQRIATVEGDKRRNYTMGLKNIFNFPLSPGKQWKHAYSAKPILVERYESVTGTPTLDYYEKIKILGWEDIGVKAGKFRVLKIEFISGHEEYRTGMFPRPGYEEKDYYWYSPDVKYFVRAQYDKSLEDQPKKVFNWELTSFQLKK